MSHAAWINSAQHPLFDGHGTKEVNDVDTWDEKEPMFLDGELNDRSSSSFVEEYHFSDEHIKEEHEELFFISKSRFQNEDELHQNEANHDIDSTLLRTAVETGDQQNIFHLQRGISIDLPLIPSGETALCLAITNQNIDLVRSLLTHHASSQPPLYNAQLPLHTAAESGNLVIIELLLKHDADIHALSLGHTALDKATSATIAAVLIDAGMYPKELNNALLWKAAYGGRNAKDVVSVILREGGFVDAVNGEGWTSLKWACKRGDGEMVRVLVEAGAKVDEHCVGVAREHGFLNIVAFLNGLVTK